MPDSRNYIIAIVLSLVVLLGWQYFIVQPKVDEQRRQDEIAQIAQSQKTQAPVPGTPGATAPTPGMSGIPSVPGGVVVPVSRETTIAATQRVAIETESLSGSINLTGGRIDDLHLTKYREEVDPDSPTITLLSPSGSESPYYANVNWAGDPGAEIALPTPTTLWAQEGYGTLTSQTPVTINWDNGQGLNFRRTISVDDDYMFTIDQSVENNSGADVRLYPYGLISRHGKPETTGFYILHEGLIGVFGEDGLKEVDYDDVEEKRKSVPPRPRQVGSALPTSTGQRRLFRQTRVTSRAAFPTARRPRVSRPTISATWSSPPNRRTRTVHATRLFAGAKQVDVIDAYQEASLGIHRFEPDDRLGLVLFPHQAAVLQSSTGCSAARQFRLAILAVTVVVKASSSRWPTSPTPP